VHCTCDQNIGGLDEPLHTEGRSTSGPPPRRRLDIRAALVTLLRAGRRFRASPSLFPNFQLDASRGRPAGPPRGECGAISEAELGLSALRMLDLELDHRCRGKAWVSRSTWARLKGTRHPVLGSFLSPAR
jgi:hypothetical protein